MENDRTKLDLLTDVSGDKDLIANLYGGKEAFNNDFPATYERLRHSHKDATSVNAAEADIRVLHVGFTDNTHQKVCMLLYGKGKEVTGYTRLKAVAVNKNTKQEIVSFGSVNFLGSGVRLRIELSLDEYKNCVIYIYLITAGSDVNMLVKEITPSDYGIDVEATFTVSAPKKIKTTFPDQIRVALFSGSLPDYDYYSSSSYIELPGSGKVTLKSETFFDVVNKSMIMMSDSQKTPAMHGALSNPTLAGAEMSWNMPLNWGMSVSSFIEYKKLITARYYFSVTCHLVGDDRFYSFLVTNDPIAKGNAVYYFPQEIVIIADCIAEGSLIKLADKTECLVQQLQSGDSVLDAETGKTVKVYSVCKTSEDSIPAYIQLSNGLSLYCSVTHPIMTENGFKSANLIQAGDKVMTDAGLVAVTDTRGACQSEKMIFYAVTLEGGKTFYANSIAVGDSSAQSITLEAEADMRKQIKDEWLQDFDSFVNRKEVIGYE